MPEQDPPKLLVLPSFIQTKEQVHRTLTEILQIEDFLNRAQNREAGSKLSLPKNIQLKPVNPVTKGVPEIPRNGSITLLHQAWRYGGKCESPTDHDCEQQLQKVLNWIQGELK